MATNQDKPSVSNSESCAAVKVEDLRERERDVLCELVQTGLEWHKARHVGGRDGSHHSYTLSKLAERGYVEKKPIGKQYKYRISNQGWRLVRWIHENKREVAGMRAERDWLETAT